MKLGIGHLIAEGSGAHVEQIRTFNAAMQAAAGEQPAPDLSTPEGLRVARSQLSNRPPDPRASERVARAGARQVPVRVITPAEGQARAVYLQIHGGGFYMDCAARERRPQRPAGRRPGDRRGQRRLPPGPRTSVAGRP